MKIGTAVSKLSLSFSVQYVLVDMPYIATLCCCRRATVSQHTMQTTHPSTHWHASDLTVGEDVNEQRKKRKRSHRPLSSFHRAPRDIVQLCRWTSFKLCAVVLFSGSKVKLSSKSLLRVHVYKWYHESRRQMEVSGWLKEKCIAWPRPCDLTIPTGYNNFVHQEVQQYHHGQIYSRWQSNYLNYIFQKAKGKHTVKLPTEPL